MAAANAQQRDQQQQLQSPKAASPVWPPPTLAEFENVYSVSGGRLRGKKGRPDGLVVKLSSTCQSIVRRGSVGC